jgi:mono/diheme cytochrome c family protein
MKITSKLWMGSLAAAGFMLFAGGAMADGPRADVIPPQPADTVSGAAVYEKSCTKCHGADGKGETGMGKKAKEKGEKWADLSTSKLDKDKVTAIVKDGVADTKMKGYGDKLSAAELQAVTDFVVGLRK